MTAVAPAARRRRTVDAEDRRATPVAAFPSSARSHAGKRWGSHAPCSDSSASCRGSCAGPHSAAPSRGCARPPATFLRRCDTRSGPAARAPFQSTRQSRRSDSRGASCRDSRALRCLSSVATRRGSCAAPHSVAPSRQKRAAGASDRLVVRSALVGACCGRSIARWPACRYPSAGGLRCCDLAACAPRRSRRRSRRRLRGRLRRGRRREAVNTVSRGQALYAADADSPSPLSCA